MQLEDNSIGTTSKRVCQQGGDLWNQHLRRNILKAVALAAVLACSLVLITFSPRGRLCSPSNIALLKNRFALYHAGAP
jgi:hypothetical protein